MCNSVSKLFFLLGILSRLCCGHSISIKAPENEEEKEFYHAIQEGILNQEGWSLKSSESAKNHISFHYYVKQGVHYLDLNRFDTGKIKFKSLLKESNKIRLLSRVTNSMELFLSSEEPVKEKVSIARRLLYVGMGSNRIWRLSSNDLFFNLHFAYSFLLESWKFEVFWDASFATENENDSSLWSIGAKGVYVLSKIFLEPSFGIGISGGRAEHFQGPSLPPNESKGLLVLSETNLKIFSLESSYFTLSSYFEFLLDQTPQGYPMVFGIRTGYYF